jgi:glycerol-3-phosphate acyltransferase PlsY
LTTIQPWAFAVLILGGYLMGSIPFGVIATRLGGMGDIRQVGSGNIGATNVLRTGRKDLAFITLVGDGGKGAAAVGLAWLAFGRMAPATAPMACALAGGAAFIGHLFPIWLGFKGGKGVATALGVLLAVAWPIGLVACAVWLLVAATARMSSLASLASVASAPALALIVEDFGVVKLAFTIAVLVFVRHQANIRRLIAGTEPRIGQGNTERA